MAKQDRLTMRLKLEQETLGLSSVLERIARVRVKDCFKDDNNKTIYFIVEVGDLGKAIGKGGVNIRVVQQELGRRVRVVEYRNNVSDFVKSFIYPI
ncbi:KH domain-containing protein [Candidatus Woesearchaeota archaeon]|nr:KH domain-containing protein [Candidatus Woesearchaeota archaeon]